MSVSQNESEKWVDTIEIECQKTPQKKRTQQMMEEENEDQDRLSVEVIGEWKEKGATIVKLSREEYYGRVPHNHRPPITPLIADPIFRNPNSFESMIEIFREILKKNVMRKWVAIVMDGVPYVLGLKVIAWSMICEQCGESVFKETGKSKHTKLKHGRDPKPATFKQEFGNLLLIPVGGHIFMNVSCISSELISVWRKLLCFR